jgi:hypothetical protein
MLRAAIDELSDLTVKESRMGSVLFWWQTGQPFPKNARGHPFQLFRKYSSASFISSERSLFSIFN